jgi:hypothetical protein
VFSKGMCLGRKTLTVKMLVRTPWGCGEGTVDQNFGGCRLRADSANLRIEVFVGCFCVVVATLGLLLRFVWGATAQAIKDGDVDVAGDFVPVRFKYYMRVSYRAEKVSGI